MSERVLAINTVQGIGDLFWVYQKLAPYVDSLLFNILCQDPNNAIQRRSEAFCKMLPKVSRAIFRKSRIHDYQRLVRGRYALKDVLKTSRHQLVDYAVNAPLEAGINLRDVDPDMRVDEFVDLGLPKTVERENYLCLYVAGSKSVTVWGPLQWARVADRLAMRLGTTVIRLIGAAWDKPVQDEVERHLSRYYLVENHVGAELPETIELIRGSRYFLGYQSGLNVLAENYDVPQLMIYFDKLAPMLYTWCKPASVRTIFHATTFSGNVDEVIDSLPNGEPESLAA